MCASVLPELWMVTTYMPGALGDQVKVLGALELEVQVVASCRMGTGFC